jgi:hypothetical protein
MTNGEESRGPGGLEPDPIVDKLVPDPSEPAVPAVMLEGFLGPSARDGYWRLYFTTELNEYSEFREVDLLHREPIAKEYPPFTGLESTRLWIKPNAEVMHTRVESRQVQASFLRGDIEIDSIAEAGPAAGQLGIGPFGGEAAGVTAIVTNTVACRVPVRGSYIACPTALLGCGSRLICMGTRWC